MHPENFPSSISINDYFCIADISSEVSTPLDQMEALKLYKMIGVPMTYKGLHAGSMILAVDRFGPIIMQLKYLDRLTKLSKEEVEQFEAVVQEWDNSRNQKKEEGKGPEGMTQ